MLLGVCDLSLGGSTEPPLDPPQSDQLQELTTDLPSASENQLKFFRCACKQGSDSRTGAHEEHLVFNVHIAFSEYRSVNFIN